MINYYVLNKSCLLTNYDVCRYWVEVMCCQMTEPYSRGMWRVSSGSLTGETSELSVSNLHTSIVCVNLFVLFFFEEGTISPELSDFLFHKILFDN